MVAKGEDKILEELVSIVGKENATAAKHIRYAYSYDLSFVKPKLPDYVVMATTVEQIQAILKLANREKIPVVPFTAGTNIGGLCIPERGGILLDLKRMNKIIRIDAESHYADHRTGCVPCAIGYGALQAQPQVELARGTSVGFLFLLRHQSRDRGIERTIWIEQRRDHQHGSGSSHG